MQATLLRSLASNKILAALSWKQVPVSKAFRRQLLKFSRDPVS